MMTASICYYLKNPQCIPIMSVLNQHVPGTVIAYRAGVAAQFKKESPGTMVPHLNFLTRRFLSLKNCNAVLKNIVQAKIIVMSATNAELIPHCLGKKVMVFHGTFRYITKACAENLMLFDMTWVNSPRQARMLEHYSKTQLPYHLIGYLPFLNFQDKTSASQDSIRKKLNLHPTRPIVAYLPARRNVGSWCSEALNIAQQAPNDIELIMRPHPNQLSQTKSDEAALLSALKKVIATRDNIHLDPGFYPYNDLLCIADLVISDATSPAEESLYYDAAQLFTRANPAAALEKECREGGMPEAEIKGLLKLYDCGIDLSRQSFKNWGDAISAAITQKNNFAEHRRDYFSNAFGNFSKANIISRLKDAVASLS